MKKQVPFVCFSPHERDFFVRRVISGKFNFEYENMEYTFLFPNNSINAEGAFIYYDTYEKMKDSSITENKLLDILIDKHSWKYEDEKFLLDYEEKIKEIKCDMFKNLYNGARRIYLKQEIKTLTEKYNEKYIIRHSLDQYTAHGIAQEAKWLFFLEHCLFSKKKRVSMPEAQLIKVLGIIWSNFLNESEIRDLAKNEPWQTFWFISGGKNIFSRKVMDYTDEQVKLCTFSKMYDNIRKSYKPPSEDVISDDDLLDGWIYMNNKEREQERNINNMDARLGKKIRDSQELFIPVNSVEEAKKINSLNNQNDKMIKQRFLDGIKK